MMMNGRWIGPYSGSSKGGEERLHYPCGVRRGKDHLFTACTLFGIKVGTGNHRDRLVCTPVLSRVPL